jgi:hypothetical protein
VRAARHGCFELRVVIEAIESTFWRIYARDLVAGSPRGNVTWTKMQHIGVRDKLREDGDP